MEAKCPKCQSEVIEHEMYKLVAPAGTLDLWVKVRECSKCHFSELYAISPQPR